MDVVVKALASCFSPLRIMTSSSAVAVVIKDYQSKNLRSYCEQALSVLKIRDFTIDVLEYHSRGLKAKMSKVVGFNVLAGTEKVVDILFTGDAEALPDGTPDPIFLGFRTAEQAALVEEMCEKHGEGLVACMATLKAAAQGKGFKEYFLELISILEFEECGRGSALSIAEQSLGRQQLRTCMCPATKMTVYVRGKAAEEKDNETIIGALRYELKGFKFVDTDNSGTVSVDELCAALEAQGVADAAGKAAEYLGKYDVGGDGVLQVDEYKALFVEVFQD